MYRSLDRPGKGWPLVNVRNMVRSPNIPRKLTNLQVYHWCMALIQKNQKPFKEDHTYFKKIKEKKKQKKQNNKKSGKKVWRLRANVFN